MKYPWHLSGLTKGYAQQRGSATSVCQDILSSVARRERHPRSYTTWHFCPVSAPLETCAATPCTAESGERRECRCSLPAPSPAVGAYCFASFGHCQNNSAVAHPPILLGAPTAIFFLARVSSQRERPFYPWPAGTILCGSRASRCAALLPNLHGGGLFLISLLAQCTGSPAIAEPCESDGACMLHNDIVVRERMGNKEGLYSTLSRVPLSLQP